jgi:hypothetical protein
MKAARQGEEVQRDASYHRNAPRNSSEQRMIESDE